MPENTIFEAIGKRAIEGASPNQVLHLEVSRVELADCLRHTAKTARWDHSGDAAAIGQSRVENGLRFGNIVT